MGRGLGVDYGRERDGGAKKKKDTATLQWDMKLSERVGNGMKIRVTLYVVFRNGLFSKQRPPDPKNGARDWSASLTPASV